MKSLMLLRHAKSSWDQPDCDDFDRGLTKRGMRAAKLMAAHMKKTGLKPAAVLCSSAVRTRQTLDLLVPALGDVPITYDKRIYEASRQMLLDRIAELPATLSSVLLVGHNPGLERLALSLADDSAPNAALSGMSEKFPTCTLAVINCPTDDWACLPLGGCSLDLFIRPSDLGEED